jgi:excisionase family DNA binding protein
MDNETTTQTAVQGLAGSLPRSGEYLIVEEVARRHRMSVRTVHELTRTRQIPHVKLPGRRRCLFREDWLDEWQLGCELESSELDSGGRIVRPCLSTPRKVA